MLQGKSEETDRCHGYGCIDYVKRMKEVSLAKCLAKETLETTFSGEVIQDDDDNFKSGNLHTNYNIQTCTKKTFLQITRP